MKYRNYNAKRALPLMAFAVAAFATSCSNDGLADGSSQSSESGKAQTVELTASLNDDNGTDTRVGMSKNDDRASFYWHKDEAILVQTVSGDTYPGAEFTTSAETGATTATFTGTISDGSLGSYAVYPYSTSHTFTSATALTYNLPAEYTYSKVESNVFSKTEDGTYPVNSTNIPLVGKIDNGNIAFKHIGGLAVIRIDKMPYKAGTLTVSADQQLSGNFDVADLSASDAKIVTTTTDTEADKTVTFTFSGASQGNAGVFYLPVATGSYSGVKITVASSGNTTSSTVDYATLDVARASVTAIPLYNYSGTIDKYRDQSREINGHRFIDLGLSVLWAETNVGAEAASGYGNYYAWGEVNVHTKKEDHGGGDHGYPGEGGDYGSGDDGSASSGGLYSWSTYTYGTSWNNLNKYNDSDNKTTLEASDDVATANWGDCRMPTNDEFSELINSANCDWDWTTVDDVYGWKITGKKTGNSIFLPASGYYDGDDLKGGCTGDDFSDVDCYYWSSSRNPNASFYDMAYTLNFRWYEEYTRTPDMERYYGCPVRAVAAKQ